MPIPEISYTETIAQFDYLMKMAEQKYMDIVDERLLFRGALNGFEQNPGGSFGALRGTLFRLGYKVGQYVWIEAERATDTNFSEATDYPGASSTHALVLKTAIQPGQSGYYAEFTIPVRTKEDQEVWIAAKVPAERRGNVSVFVGGQLMRLPENPVLMYGQGLGWYKLGSTKLAGSTSKLRVMVDSAGSEIAIDAILLTPRPFQPSGVTPPQPVDFPAAIKK